MATGKRRPALPPISSVQLLKARLAVEGSIGRAATPGLIDVEVLYVDARLLLRRKSTQEVLIDVAFEDLDQDEPILEQLRGLLRSVMCPLCDAVLLDGEKGVCIPCEAGAVKALFVFGVDLEAE